MPTCSNKLLNEKNVLSHAIASCTLFASQASAQGLVENVKSNLFYGPKIGANVSGFRLSDMPESENEMKFGGSAGVFIGYRISKNFSIQEDIMLNYTTTDIKNESTIHYKSLDTELTFYAMGNFNVANGSKILFGAGPFASYGLSSKAKTNGDEINMFKKYDNQESAFNRLNVGAAVIAGYEMKCGLQITASYKLGLMDRLNANKDNATLLPSTICLSIGYRFGH